jgi:hypothetical protein
MSAQRHILSAMALLGAILPAVHASTLTITPTFDSTITSDPNAAVIEGAINTAIQTIENTYKNNVTLTIYFQEGGGLGESNTAVYSESYKTYYDALVASNADPAAIAGLDTSGGDADTNGGINPVSGTHTIELKPADAAAVGISLPDGCVPTSSSGDVPNVCGGGPGTAYDGIISLNTGITFPPNSNSGSYYDLVSVAEHEIDEVMGLGSALENCDPTDTSDTAGCQTGTINLANDTVYGTGSPQDLFRYTAATGGVLSNLSVNCSSPGSAYFAYGANTGEINQLNNACNDDDFGDWSNSGYVQSAVGTPGITPAYGTSEIDAMSAIGYELAAPEPGTLGLMGASLIGLVFLRKRMGRKDGRSLTERIDPV